MKSLVGLRLTPTVERNRNANPVFRRVFTRGRARLRTSMLDNRLHRLPVNVLARVRSGRGGNMGRG